MIREIIFSQNPGIRIFSVAVAALMVCVSGNAATTHEQTDDERQRQQIRYYRTIYDREIFHYCVKRYRYKESRLASCLKRHGKLKQKILSNALRRFASQSLAQRIYDECYYHHPHEGVGRIGQCVNTRLALRDELEDEGIEQEIYKNCVVKWRKHGAMAIDNCSLSGASYYQDKGVLRD